MASGPFHFLVFQVAHSSKVSEFGFCTSLENRCIYSRRFHCQSNPRTRFNRFFTHRSVHLTPNNSGLVFAVGIDVLIDGMLVGAGLTLGA